MAVGIPRNDLFAGGIFMALGAYFATESLNYELGTPFRMGPGFLPLVLGCVLAGLGLAIGLSGLRKGNNAGGEDDAERHAFPWRALALILFAIALFGFTIRGLGFVPTVFLTAFLTAFASRRTRLAGALAIAGGLTALSTLVFVVGLRLQVPMIGPWLGF